MYTKQILELFQSVKDEIIVDVGDDVKDVESIRLVDVDGKDGGEPSKCFMFVLSGSQDNKPADEQVEDTEAQEEKAVDPDKSTRFLQVAVDNLPSDHGNGNRTRLGVMSVVQNYNEKFKMELAKAAGCSFDDVPGVVADYLELFADPLADGP